MDIKQEAREMKQAAPRLAATSVEERNQALKGIAEELEKRQAEIFAANEVDLKNADDNGISDAVKKRLKFDQHKLSDVIAGIQQLISLPDPLGKVLLKRQLDDGLILNRISCPIGVIGVIFEARPDALVQISSLCMKSGNCAILKGGKETAKTNKALFEIIHSAVVEAGLPEKCLVQAELHNEIDELLKCEHDVDLLIPRGSNAFVQYIMNNTKIPVMGHADGICHTYVDVEADFEKAIPILLDAKTQYTAACNATETILIHRAIAEDFLPLFAKAFADAGVRVRGTAEVMEVIGKGCIATDQTETLESVADTNEDRVKGKIKSDIMQENEFATEYLDMICSVKLVDDVDEAISHINRFGSHHTDAIITENDKTAEHFMQMVDSAGVYQNCSTRFADGFRYGFGAEVGISTSKLHARGPVGLEGLVTYKYKLYGSGQIVGDYASGKSEFHFMDL